MSKWNNKGKYIGTQDLARIYFSEATLLLTADSPAISPSSKGNQSNKSVCTSDLPPAKWSKFFSFRGLDFEALNASLS